MGLIRLAELESTPEEVELPNGSVYTVKRFDGFAADLWASASEDGTDDSALLYQLVRLSLPDASEEEVKSLTVTQAAAVVSVATGNVEKVLAALKNGTGVEAAVSADSAPTTPSAQ